MSDLISGPTRIYSQAELDDLREANLAYTRKRVLESLVGCYVGAPDWRVVSDAEELIARLEAHVSMLMDAAR